VPLVGVGTLDAVAHRLRETADGLVGVLGDAMRGEVYPALFRVRAGLVERSDPDRVSAPLQVAEEWATLGEPVSLTGNGLAKHGSLFGQVMGSRAREVPVRLWTPDGASLIGAAWATDGPGSLRSIAMMARAEAYAAAHPAALLPVYTRLSDAEEAERQRFAGASADGVGVPAAGVAGPEGSS
jgi:N6-L-threonylcarbamoyladenine synthase